MLSAAIRKHVGLKVAITTIVSTSVFLGLFTLVITQLNTALANPGHLWILFVCVTVFCVFFQFVLITLMVNTLIERPLSKLYQAMQRVQDGNLTAKCEVITEDEFKDVARCFNDMLCGLNEMNEKRKNIEKRLIQTEESLKYKIELENKSRIIKRMNEELTEAFNTTALLYSVSQYLNSVLDLKELVTIVQIIFEEKFKCQQYFLALVDRHGTGLTINSHKGLPMLSTATDNLHLAAGEGLAGMTAVKQRIYHLDDISHHPQVGIELTNLEKTLNGAVMSLPLVVRGQLIGVLIVSRSEQNSFLPTDRQSLEAIANQIAVAFDRCELYTKTRELSVTDDLTGIANRRHFQQMMTMEFKRAERYKRHLSLLMIDADHFKLFNDTYGHLAGDDMLKRMAQLIRKNLREVDILARYGGEEFIVLLTDTALTDAVTVANKLRELLKANLRIDTAHQNQPHHVSISVGVSAYPDCANSTEDLIHTADMALYTAKSRGRDCVHAFKPSLPLEELMTRAGISH